MSVEQLSNEEILRELEGLTRERRVEIAKDLLAGAGAVLDAYPHLLVHDGKRYLVLAPSEASRHPQHETLVLPHGTYQVLQQREYTPQVAQRGLSQEHRATQPLIKLLGIGNPDGKTFTDEELDRMLEEERLRRLSG